MTTNKVSGSCGALQQMTGNIEAQLLVGGGGRQFSQYTLIMKIKQTLVDFICVHSYKPQAILMKLYEGCNESFN